jgi:hypothetical protein
MPSAEPGLARIWDSVRVSESQRLEAMSYGSRAGCGQHNRRSRRPLPSVSAAEDLLVVRAIATPFRRSATLGSQTWATRHPRSGIAGGTESMSNAPIYSLTARQGVMGDCSATRLQRAPYRRRRSAGAVSTSIGGPARRMDRSLGGARISGASGNRVLPGNRMLPGIRSTVCGPARYSRSLASRRLSRTKDAAVSMHCVP